MGELKYVSDYKNNQFNGSTILCCSLPLFKGGALHDAIGLAEQALAEWLRKLTLDYMQIYLAF